MSLLIRSTRPAFTCVAALRPATRLAVVPARRFATQQQQGGNVYQKPLGEPIAEAAGEAIADVKHAATTLKDGVKLKVRQMQNSGAIDEAKQKAAELGVKAKRAFDQASSKVGDAVDPQGATRRVHTSSSSWARSADTAAADLKDDATRLAQKVSNRSTQVGAEIKEQGQSLLHSVKKTARKVGAAVTDAVEGATDAATSASNPVRQSSNNPELSTSKRPGNVIGGQGESSLGENMSSVKKSLFDGPQEMPQGVGKRATDANGKPLETGAPRT